MSKPQKAKLIIALTACVILLAVLFTQSLSNPIRVAKSLSQDCQDTGWQYSTFPDPRSIHTTTRYHKVRQVNCVANLSTRHVITQFKQKVGPLPPYRIFIDQGSMWWYETTKVPEGYSPLDIHISPNREGTSTAQTKIRVTIKESVNPLELGIAKKLGRVHISPVFANSGSTATRTYSSNLNE